VSEGGLTQTRWAVEEDVFDRLFAAFGGLDGDTQFAEEGFLAVVLGEVLGTESVVETIFVV